jgi:hypothetical protein
MLKHQFRDPALASLAAMAERVSAYMAFLPSTTDGVIERVHTPAFLQGVAVNFKKPDLIADRVAPRKRVDKQTNYYHVFGKDAYNTYDSTWAPGAIPNVIKTEMSKDQYFAQIRKLRHPLLDAELVNSDQDFDLRVLYTERATYATMLAREKRVATLFTTSSNYPGGNVITKSAGTTDWTAAGVINTVQPITDIEALIQVVRSSSLYPRNLLTVVIPENVFDLGIRNNSAIRDYYKYTMGGVITPDLWASLLGVKEVIISSGYSAGPGPANIALDIVSGITTTYLWGKNVWIGVIDPSDMGLSFAKTFWWAPETGGQEFQIAQYRMPDPGQEGSYIECKESVDEKIIASLAGGLIVQAIA